MQESRFPSGITETFEKYEILFEFEEGDNFYHRNTLGILRINPPKFGGGLKFEPDKEIGQKGRFAKVSSRSYLCLASACLKCC